LGLELGLVLGLGIGLGLAFFKMYVTKMHVYTIEQMLSKRQANVFKIHVLIVRRLLDVCSIV